MNGVEMPDDAIYTGDSMRGAFVPGETIFLSETAFETLREGDVVAIFERTPYYVHRIVEKNEECAVTMGDNNARPDTLKLSRDSRFKVVTEVRGLDGSMRKVSGGEPGMEQFRRQQHELHLRRFVGTLLRPLRPLKNLRIPAKTETKYRDGTVQWSCGGIPVAARTAQGKTKYLHWSKRFFFRIPEHGKEKPEKK